MSPPENCSTTPITGGLPTAKIEFRRASNGKELGRKPLRAALMTMLILLAALCVWLWIYKTTPRARDAAESGSLAHCPRANAEHFL